METADLISDQQRRSSGSCLWPRLGLKGTEPESRSASLRVHAVPDRPCMGSAYGAQQNIHKGLKGHGTC